MHANIVVLLEISYPASDVTLTQLQYMGAVACYSVMPLNGITCSHVLSGWIVLK